jgi:hypothetical protein
MEDVRSVFGHWGNLEHFLWFFDDTLPWSETQHQLELMAEEVAHFKKYADETTGARRAILRCLSFELGVPQSRA